MVSGIASYGWSDWIASETGSACDLSRAGAFGGATLIVLYFARAIVVVYAAIRDSEVDACDHRFERGRWRLDFRCHLGRSIILGRRE